MYRFKAWRTALAVFVAIGVLVAHTGVSATGEAFSGAADKAGVIGNPVAINDLSITGTGDDNLTVNVYVDNGFVTFGSTTGLTGDTGGGSDITFSGARSDINAALATLSYRNNDVGVWSFEATIVSGNGEIYDPVSGHVYQIIDNGGMISWNSAKTAAEGMTYGGASGYLATLTSEQENDYIAGRLGQSGWIGASDSASEGDWKWVTGPEAGTSFWSGDGEGVAVGSEYSNWNPGEPNDSGGTEDCAEFTVGGYGGWNDLNCGTATRQYYVVEFGDGETNPSIATTQIDITMSVPEFDSGDGSEVDPYIISDCEQLQAVDYIADTTGVYFELGDDVDCSMTNPDSDNFDPNGIWDSEDGFLPIGTSNGYFAGYFDGNGFAISDLFIDRYGTDEVGLFSGSSSGSAVQNLELSSPYVEGTNNVGALIGDGSSDLSDITITDMRVIGDNAVGGIVGYSDGADADNVHATGYLYGDDEESGGLFGYFDYGDLSNCSFSGEMETYYETGGIVGENEGPSTITRCWSEGTLTAGDTDVGGIIGEVEDTIEITESFSTMTLIGDDVGGLIGTVFDDTVLRDSYYIGDVSSTGDAGLIIGYNGSSSYDLEVENVYGAGTVEGSGQAGGFIGESESTDVYQSSFWDVTTSGFDYGCDPTGGSCDGLFGLSTNQMQTSEVYKNAGWNFSTIWAQKTTQNAGYPCLRWVGEDCVGSVTASGLNDSDNDGVADDVESAAPNSGDANNDGTQDASQSSVAALVDPVTGNYAVLEVSVECNITSVSIATESTNTAADSGYDYPAGMMDFTLDCGDNVGFTATVSQYYYGVSGDFAVRKYNPNTQTYQSIDSASISDQTIAGNQVKLATYQVQDGGALDLDGIANGTIEDPAGLAQTAGNLSSTGEDMARAIVAGLALIIVALTLGATVKKSSRILL